MSNTSQASERIKALLDDNSFVEIGELVTARATDFNMKQTDTPSDGVVTGYGVIGGSLVYVYSQDASVMNGSVGEMHAKKIAGLYALAMKTGAPVIGLLDCAGMRLQEATDALNGFGEIYKSQALSSGVIPQITAIFGTCGGGLALIPTLTDFTFMEKSKAKLFVNAPNALDGNVITKCDTSAADFQSREAGIVDCVADEATIFAKIRELVSLLPSNNEDDAPFEACVDSGKVFEVKEDYAKDMVTAFIKLNGMTVGAIANRTESYDENGKVSEKFDEVLSPEGCDKAADFVSFCDAFEIPVLTLTNVKGFKATTCAEKKIAKAAARLTYAFANATVAKVNVVTKKAFGSAYVTMNSKAIGADVTFAWEG